VNTAAEFLQASHRNRDFRRRPARVFWALFSHNLQVAGFAAKQAAIEAGGDASSAKIAVKEWDVPTPNSHPMIRRWPRWRALVHRTGIEYVGVARTL